MIDSAFPNGVTHYLLGGLAIGVAVGLVFVTTGLVTGMSTFFSSTWSYASRLPFFQQTRFTATRSWRLALASGVVLGGTIYLVTLGGGQPFVTAVPWWQLGLGGFLAGYGARLGNGCTSGHGVCGMASGSKASILAVVIFLATAIATAHIVGALGGA